MSEEKKEWEDREIEAMAKIAGRNPILLPSLDEATGGRVSAYIQRAEEAKAAATAEKAAHDQETK